VPLIQIDMQSARAEQRSQISEAVHSALVEAWEMPADDLFQIFHLHDADDLVYSRTYPNANRSDIVFVQILAFNGYSPELKQRGARLVVDRLSAVGIKRDEILIAITENGDGDWFAPSEDD
jgi:Tautomerase enzyme